MNLFNSTKTAGFQLKFVRFAHKKAGGVSRNGRGSPGQHLGPKATHGELVQGGRILVRQRGLRFHPGANVVVGRDDTLNAHTNGQVRYSYDITKRRTFVSVEPIDSHPQFQTINHVNSLSKHDHSVQLIQSALQYPGHVFFPTKEVAKQRLKELVSPISYLQQTAEERYQHINKLIRDSRTKDKTQALENAESSLLKRRRPFGLIDITLY